MSLIFYDHRERRSGVIKVLMKHKLNIKEATLISADYIIQSKIDGKIVEVGIERKTNLDFLSSMIDKRLLSQLITLKENFSYPVLIIEGEENIFSLRNFHPNSIRGMLLSVALDYQIPIIHTKGAADTAAYIKMIAGRFEKGLPKITLRAKKPLTLKEQQEFIVEGLPGIGSSLTKSLLKKFRSVRKIANASVEELKKVEKIGKKKAEKIKEVFEEDYSNT
jgi:ERCC4-type nuclease